MTQKKPIVNKGIILYKDYEYLFNFLSDEELGKVIRLLLRNAINDTTLNDTLNDTLKGTVNPTDNKNINNVYNYIINRITDYQQKRVSSVESGLKGGNPILKTLKGTVNPPVKLKEKKIKEKNIFIEKNFSENFSEKRNLIVKNIKNFNYNKNEEGCIIENFFDLLKDYNDDIITEIFKDLKKKAVRKNGACYLPCDIVAEETAKEVAEAEKNRKLRISKDKFWKDRLLEGVQEIVGGENCFDPVIYPIKDLWNKLTPEEQENYSSN